MMRYKLYLDDLRYPPADTDDWRLARNYHDALWYVKTYGIPYHISFDHDLGPDAYGFVTIGRDPLRDSPKEFTGLDFAKWFCLHVLVNGLDLPDDFGYTVHSANPVGAENIRCYMENFIKDGYV
jgi:hypothetical protein